MLKAMVRKTISLTAALALLALSTGSWADHDDDDDRRPRDLVKLACSTADGNVIGGDSTTFPKDESLCEPCSRGDRCVLCLHALLRKGCDFDKNIPSMYLDDVGPDESEGSAVLYHLRGNCVRELCEVE